MKKFFIIVFVCLVAYTSSNGQNKYAESLKALIAKTNKPLEKFDLLNKLGEGLFSTGMVKVDYAFCFQLLTIAQDLKNDSLLAISYNWIGNFFS